MRNVLGVDIGGSHITVALVDLNSGQIQSDSQYRREVDCNDEAEVILSHWCEVILVAYQNLSGGERRMGIAMPGPFNYKDGICLIKDQEKFRSLYQLNIKKELALRLHMDVADIKFVNDAAAFLQGEIFSGAAQGGKRVMGFTLGTGLGSAFCEKGVAEDAALWQSPFKDGIAEDYLSTRWFVSRYLELTGQDIAGVKELTAIEDQKVIQLIFDEFSLNLDAFLAPLIQLRDADIVVLGGNIANANSLFLPLLQRNLIKRGLKVAVKVAELQENASLIGAASTGENEHLKY